MGYLRRDSGHFLNERSLFCSLCVVNIGCFLQSSISHYTNFEMDSLVVPEFQIF